MTVVAWPSLIGHLTSVDVKQNYSFICGMTVSWSGLAVRLVSRSCPDSASALSFLFKSCGLWILSCDFVPHNY